MTTLAAVQPDIKRDGWGRPLVIPVGGGKARGYTRVTTLAGTLEDTYNLQRWMQRQVIVGLVDRPDLLLSAAAHRDDRAVLDDIADKSIEAAKAGAAATIGTALHALAEQLDAGHDLGPIPGEYRRDLDAYVAATKCLTVLHSERFVVLDDIACAGTPDRIVEYDGERYIADIKTGSIDYGGGKIAMQLALYAHGRFYDFATGEREPLPAVNGQRGIVIHMPAGTGTARLIWVNIAAGWEQVAVALGVRAWRKRKDLFAEWDEHGAMSNLVDAGLIDDPISAQLLAAPNVEALTRIWADNRGAWTTEHTATAAARKLELTGGTA